MIKIRNIIIYIVVFIIVFSSFKISQILLQIDSNNIEIAIYNKEKTNSIDVEAQKIYLVKAIHDIEEGSSIVISRPTNQYLFVEKIHDINNELTRNIDEQIHKLEENKILKNININDKNYKMGIITKNYQNNKNSYTVNHIILTFDDNEYNLNMENKTGKILFISCKKEQLYNEENKQEMLENYIKYLNLYVIDDWQYEPNENNNIYKMKSQKASLAITFEQIEEIYMFSIHIS